VLAIASLVAALTVDLGPRWRGRVGLEAGDAFAGIEARSESHAAAGTLGPTLGARIGFGYAF
jgi:hypothetical protein